MGLKLRPVGVVETGIDRLAEDHANARKLALGLAERFPGCCDPDAVETNMFHARVAAFRVGGQQLAGYLAREGILVFPREPRMRFATHRMVSSEDIDEVLRVFDQLRKVV